MVFQLKAASGVFRVGVGVAAPGVEAVVVVSSKSLLGVSNEFFYLHVSKVYQ